jgi:hypothetical protein
MGDLGGRAAGIHAQWVLFDRRLTKTMVTILSLQTEAALFTVGTPPETFDISHTTFRCTYQLFADDIPLGVYDSPFDAIRAVAGHKTGFTGWDSSTGAVSDDAGNWKRHFDDRFKIQLLANFIEARPNESYRSLVDYIHYKHPYLMSRLEIADLLDQLYLSGQCTALLATEMAPAEFSSHIALWKRWLGQPEAK